MLVGLPQRRWLQLCGEGRDGKMVASFMMDRLKQAKQSAEDVRTAKARAIREQRGRRR